MNCPKIYFAPMEGITGSIYRRVHRRYFDGIDDYYTPFLAINQTHKLKKRELREIIPDENPVSPIPQVLTNNADDFLWAAEELSKYGYREINLNMGCPVATVFTKHKGAGMLSDLSRLRIFLDKIFEKKPAELEITIKTRIGVKDTAELDSLIDLWNNYQFKMIIIHPRLREDYYKGNPRMEEFRKCMRQCKSPICYNGNITSVEDCSALVNEFPDLNAVMIGRGLIANPALAREIKGGTRLDLSELKDFYYNLLNEYRTAFSSDREVLFCMK